MWFDIVLIVVVLGFTLVGPDLLRRHGPRGLWFGAAVASVLVALAVPVLLGSPPPDVGDTPSLNRLFFWLALIAAGTGFAFLAFFIRIRQPAGPAKSAVIDVLLGVLVWAVGTALGAAVAAGGGLVLLSMMAP
jgi:hypothetical protein